MQFRNSTQKNRDTWLVSICVACLHLLLFAMVQTLFQLPIKRPLAGDNRTAIQAQLLMLPSFKNKAEAVTAETTIDHKSIEKLNEVSTAPIAEELTSNLSSQIVGGQQLDPDRNQIKVKNFNLSEAKKDVMRDIHSQSLKQAAETNQNEHNEKKNKLWRPSLALPTEEEKKQNAREVVIDCDTTAGKIARGLSGMTGGTLKCRKQTALAPFIERHLPPSNK